MPGVLSINMDFKQDETILDSIQKCELTNSLSCRLALSVYEELKRSDRVTALTIDWDREVEEIFVMADMDGDRGIYLVRMNNQDINLLAVEHFRKKYNHR